MNEPLLRLLRKWHFLRGNGRGVKRCSNLISSMRAKKWIKEHFNESAFPAVNVEINTNCNYSCQFCPQSSCKRPIRYMSRNAFEVLIRRLETIDYVGHVCLSVNNEPFLHPLILEFCEMISMRLPKARGSLISNGALITKEHLLALAKLDIPPGLQLNDYTPSRTVSKRVALMFESEPALKRIPFSVSLRGHEERLSNRAGNQPGCESYLEDYRDILCTWPFVGIFITAELKVTLCCSDYQHQVVMGDLERQGLMEVWNGESFRKVRATMLGSSPRTQKLCVNCDAEWFVCPLKRESR